jgi:uncharacterized protein (TIGR02466 family)
MNSNMINLFPLPLQKTKLRRAYSERELNFVKAELQSNHKSIANYASTNKYILNADEMLDIRQVLQDALDTYFKEVFNSSNKLSLKITQSWLTLTGNGESHHEHTHPNSVASGVLYINLGKNDGISFYRNEDSQWYEFLREKETFYSAKSFFIPCEAGDIVIFPSNLRHGVKQNSLQVERISLAFNTFFEGELGRDEFSNALIIKLGEN